MKLKMLLVMFVVAGLLGSVDPASAAQDPIAIQACGAVTAQQASIAAGKPIDALGYQQLKIVFFDAKGKAPRKVFKILKKAEGKSLAKQVAALAAAARVCTKTIAPPPIFTQTGTGTASTGKFRVPNDWDLAWHYDCTNFGFQGNFQVTIYDADAEGGPAIDFDNIPINQLGMSGASVEHYHSGGNLKYLQINGECNWDITITKG